MRSAVAGVVGRCWVRVMPRRVPLSALRAMVLLLGILATTLTAWAQAPQVWTAEPISDRTFPSEPAALAAVRALGGKYIRAEVVQSVTVSSTGNRVIYRYGARPRPPETGEWSYYGNGVDPAPVSSAEAAAASALANFQLKYPMCGFQSIEVERDWYLSSSALGVPKQYDRVLRMKATDTSQCSPVWTVYHWKVRTVECPAYMGWNGAECAAQGIANIWSSTIPCDQCDLRGNPVSVVSGSKVQRENDFSLGWLDFYRTLNSSYQTQGGIGRYWTHNLSMRLYGAGTAYAVVAYPSGSLMSFSGDEAVDGSGATLRSAGGGEYDLYLEDGRYRFNVSGRLSRIERYAGDTLSIEFDGKLRISRVVHSSGRIVEFGYDGTSAIGESELAYIKDLDGPLVTYAYDDEFRIRSATYRDGTSRRYLYEHPKYRFALTGIEDETGNRYATYAYNADGLAVSSEHAGSAQKATFSYLADGSTTYINALGAVEKVTFTAAQPYRKIASITTEAGTESWTYAPRTGTGSDFRRRVQSHTSRSGSVDTYTYQTLADPVYGTVSIKRKAEASNRPETRTTEVWKQRDINQMVKQVSPSRTVTWLRNPRGQITQETTQTPAGESRTTTQTYCEAVNAQAGCPVLGLLLSTDGPMHGTDDTVRYTYYPEDAPGCATSDAACTYRKGDLWKTIQPLGHVTEVLAYDGAGRPHMVMDANGVVTEYQYTPRGWMATATVRGTDDASGTYDRVTTMEYLPTGQLSKATAPDGTVVTYTYDAAQRLTAIGDGAGNRIEYTLDAAGNRVQEEYKGAGGEVKRTLSRVYNRLSQLVPSPDGPPTPTDSPYDAEDNVNSVVDALGRVSRREHDAFGRLTRQVDDEGGIAATVAMAYDSDDNQTQVIDPKQLPTTYAYNGFGDLLQQVSPDTGTTTFTVDAAGNRTTRTDARGVTATYQYDVLGRVTHIRYPDPTLDVAYTYDIAPAVCAANEQFSRGRVGTVIHAGGSTQYCHDRFGQITRKVQAVNGVATTVRYGYTAGGRLAALTYPDGTVADYLRDSLGRISEVGVTRPGQARQVVVTNVTYAPFGPATGWTYGNGRTLQRPVDQDYRTIAVHDPAPGGLSVGYGYDAVGGITELTNGDGTEVLAQYSYDALGRLTQTKDGATGTPIESYGYDATGNRTELTTNAGTHVYSYPADSHRLAAVDDETRSYDASGNTLNTGTREFVYNDANRMRQVVLAGSATENYVYNHQGERIRRAPVLGDALTAMYDEGGKWLGNYSGTGAASQQSIWLDDFPVALMSSDSMGGPGLMHIQPDQTGTPRVVVEPARDVVVWEWSSKGEAFGNQSPKADPDNDGVLFGLAMRYPGQQATEASGLIYNYQREYDAVVGRFSQSDPIGLEGGISTYGYVGGNPISGVDPDGLQARYLPRPNYPVGGGYDSGYGYGDGAYGSGTGYSSGVSAAAQLGLQFGSPSNWLAPNGFNQSFFGGMVRKAFSSSSASSSVPWPDRKKNFYVCFCRANRDGRSADNCSIDDQQSAIGYGYGFTMNEAKRMAEKDAKEKLGAKSTHHIQCRCRAPNGDRVIPHG